MNNEKLRTLMKEKKCKMRDLALVLRCTNQTVYNTFNNTRCFTMEEALKVKSHIRMNPDEFEDIFRDEEWFNLYKGINK